MWWPLSQNTGSFNENKREVSLTFWEKAAAPNPKISRDTNKQTNKQISFSHCWLQTQAERPALESPIKRTLAKQQGQKNKTKQKQLLHVQILQLHCYLLIQCIFVIALTAKCNCISVMEFKSLNIYVTARLLFFFSHYNLLGGSKATKLLLGPKWSM